MMFATTALVPAMLALAGAQPAPAPVSSNVWPFHGSEGAGGIGGWADSEVPVGVQMPYGVMRLGTDTTVCLGEEIDFNFPYNHYGGYYYQDNCIRAFSHSHAQGAGLGDGGSLGIMATRKVMDSTNEPWALNEAPYRSNFSHANETSTPSYYSAWLSDVNTLAELTITGGHSGMHRYTCGIRGNDPCVIIADGCHRVADECGAGQMQLSGVGADGSVLLTASLLVNGAFGHDCGGVPIYMTANISAVNAVGGGRVAPILSGRWADGALLPGSGTVASNGTMGLLGAWIEWPAPTTSALVITVRVGISYVSPAGAVANLRSEQKGGTLSFEAAEAAAAAAWDAQLSTIVINDIGYTNEDIAAHRVRLDSDVEGARASAALHAVPGAAPSEAGRDHAMSYARDMVEALRADPSGAAASTLSTRKRAGGGGKINLNAALSRSTTAFSQAPTSRAGSKHMGDLGIPAHPIGMPPLERVRSFYSSLYHAFSAPSVYSDLDGTYTGMDKKVHTVNWRGGNGHFFSDLSLWDVYRSQTPLMALLDPVSASDLFFSMGADWNASGWVPHWVWGSCETGCMPGSHGLAVLADFLVKGLPGPPASVLLAAATHQLASQEGGNYVKVGFVSVDESENGASLTLDYAFDDGCGAVIADIAGAPVQAALWHNRSKNYANIWGAPNGWTGPCPRYGNGTFMNPCPALDLPPILIDKWYTEGNGLQYAYSVPHDVNGLRKLFKSDADYVSLLQQQMVNTSMWPFELTFLPSPWYWAGNEPDVLAPWQFSWVLSDAWRTQYWIRWALDTYYMLTPSGVPGNDDFGELNSWAVWACLGLYPLTANPNGTYVLASPCFANVTLQLPAASAMYAGYAHAQASSAAAPVPLLNIVAHNFSASNVYVVRAALNGKQLPTPFLNHADLLPPLSVPRPNEDAAEHAARVAAGAGPSLLEFWLTSVPMVWGTGERAVVPDW